MNDDTATTDPIVPLYARWKAARTEWLLSSDARPEGDVSPMPALSETMGALMREMARTEATTPLGLALQLRAAWESFGPAGRPGTADPAEEVERPEHRIILAALNAAERMAGLPQSCPEVRRAESGMTETPSFV